MEEARRYYIPGFEALGRATPLIDARLKSIGAAFDAGSRVPRHMREGTCDNRLRPPLSRARVGRCLLASSVLIRIDTSKLAPFGWTTIVQGCVHRILVLVNPINLLSFVEKMNGVVGW